jgi:amino acid adenylation domain-containing protein
MKKVEVSKIQKQFWILNEIYPKSGAYNLFSVFRLSEPLNVGYLQKAVKTIIDRHEPLRTSFEFIDNEIFQSIKSTEEIDIPVTEVHLEEIFNEEDVHPDISFEVNRPFDLSKAPLCRITLFCFKNRISVLTIVFHHIIVDVRSEGIFSKEFSEAYNSLTRNKEIQLGGVPYQYSDYVSEIKKWYSSDQYSKKIEELSAASPDPNAVIKLPTGKVSTDESYSEGSGVFFRFEKHLADKVKLFASQNNVNPYRVFLAAYAIFLHRLSNQENIYIGLPLTNRTRPVSKSTFGCFINALPLFVDFSNEKSSRIVLEEVSGSLARLLDRQEIPFPDLVDYSRRESNTTTNPYFQTAFAFKPPMQLELDNINAKPVKIVKKENQNEFDLYLTLYPEDEDFVGYAEYSKTLFNKQTITRWTELFKKIVVQLTDFPELAVSKIDSLTDQDKKSLSEFNNTGVPFRDCLIQNLFETQAGSNPIKTAVISAGRSLTYRELDERSNQLAHNLVDTGAIPGDFVGICMERSVDMAVSVLGVLKAGCCYLPMDPSFPDDRIKYMYEDSGAKILISQSSLKEKFVHFPDMSIVLIDTDSSRIKMKSTEKPLLNINTQSLAYMIYTSGSTGKPKGVKVHHQAVVNFLYSMSVKPGISAEAKLLAVTTLSFDISVLEMFLPLSYGAQLVIAETEDIFDGRKLSDLIDLNNITVMQATPATWNILLNSGWNGKWNLKALCGGEAVPPGLVRDLLPKVESLWDMYGPTETTVWSTCCQLSDYEIPILVGTPINNTSVYIVNKNNNQVPVGAVGEVCIGGLGVTKGYHNRPELTAEKFILFENGQIIYKTGDLGRFLQDGNIELFGRSDNQIKLRGFRIEPGEIESLLSRLPLVKEAVVKIHRFSDNDERLVAFLNVDTGFIMSKEEITGSLSQDLPAYMIPSFIRISEGFPRLPNGKINKNALVFEMDDSDKGAEIDFDSLTPTQKKLINIWDEILKTGNITPSTNFFDIGGNSLLAIRILNKIKEVIGFTMSFKSFLANPTVLQTASFIDSQSITEEKAIELVHLEGTTNLPLTLNQKRLWLISRLQPDLPSYIISFTYRFSGYLNHDIFQRSLDVLFRRHLIMFSVVREADNGEPYSDIIPSKVNISFEDFSGLDEDEKSKKTDDLFHIDSTKVFDLQNGPLYRLYLVMTSKNEYYFRASIHHIIFDAWSWTVFVKDLNDIYNSLLKDSDINLEEIYFQQYDYAEWEKSSAGSKNENELKEFWRENLTGASQILNFPFDYPRREQQSGRGRYETIQLSKELTGKLRRISKKENSSLFATLLSVFGIQMQKYSGEEDINVGLPVAFRPHSKLENIFGMFVNTVVVRLKYAKEFTIRKIIHQTNDAALNAIAHQELPFETIVGIVNPERSSFANPLFQVGFVWQHNVDMPINLDGVRSEKVTGKERTSIFDLTFYLWENGDQVEGEIEYNLDLLKTDTIIRLRDNFIHLAQIMTDNPEQIFSDISMLSENDKEKLDEFNRTEVAIPDFLVQNFLENQAKIIPEKTAVIAGNSSLTYHELDSQSNQMARHLISLGVSPGDIVGICIERTVDMAISVFGVLKAGGCYLPMDPSFPDDRIKYMYEDSGAKIIISQSSLMEKFIQFDNATIFLTDSDKNKIREYSNTKPELKISSQTLAYIIYTSGSTGKPKGVKVHHQAVVNFLNSMSRRPGISTESRLIAVTTLSFDISVLELFLPLSFGAQVVIANAEDIFDGQKLSDMLDLYDITIMQATPATWDILINTGWKGKKNMMALCGGEAISPGLAKNLLLKVESLWNMYGPTETTVWSTCGQLTHAESPILVGTPVDNTSIYIVDRNNRQVPVGVIGEVCIGGLGVTKGYHNRPELTDEKFILFENGQTIYKTGDLGRFLIDGSIELFGRSDNQIKLRGFRIEPGEIESLLSRLPGVKEAVVKVQKYEEYDERLVAFLNSDTKFRLTKEEISRSLSQHLPAYMIPSFIQVSDSFPRLPNGKINKKALILKISESDQKNVTDIDSLTGTQQKLLDVWKNVLKISSVGINTNFFEAGGTSVLIPKIIATLKQKYDISIKSVNIFEYPNVKSLAEFISSREDKDKIASLKDSSGKTSDGTSTGSRDIAVIGMAGCFPGADNIDEYWDLIINGKVAISSFTREELKNKGVPEELLDNPNYVYANYIIGRADMFDSAFFEISPREADFMDPQHRLFLEICYEALENSGYAPRTAPMNVGVFAGAGINTYLIKSLLRHPDALRSIGEFQTMISNDKDYLPTRVSYKLNLTGPSLNIQSACSTSMVATHVACQSLYNRECDMALSGGVCIQLPRGNGYMHKKGGILSPLGYCRPFDEKADGTVVGEGAGAIILKRLDDAIRDKDNIYAVIKSTAINNDGSLKVGYMAPSLDGQAKVIRQAQDQAGISPDTISFIETHGTGTKLGDPIEISALKKVFSRAVGMTSYCALGAVKANIGHLDAASGIAGLIKTVLVLKNKKLPPLANFQSYNRDLEIENSPFYINTELKDWQPGKSPRRAAVSSFGIGGTNAHCIIEEWQPVKSSDSREKRYHLMPVSAMTQDSLDKQNDKYLSFFESTDRDVSDIAFTMQQGRESFKFRQLFVTDDLKEKSRLITKKGTQLFEKPRTVFMFTGQGSQYHSMSKGLYDNFPTFKKHIDHAGEVLKKKCEIDLLELLFSSESKLNINETNYAQPALVAVQYATAKLLEEFGIKPDVLIGHSIGELTAACISGVFSFEDILVLSARRGKIMHEQPRGSMLSVNMPEEKLRSILAPGVEISLINAPDFCVVSGTDQVISDFKEKIAKSEPGIQTVILKTSHAFHSELMDPAVAPFKSMVEYTLRNDIQIPFISNTTGVLIKNEEARSAAYWSGHIRKTVNFAKGVKTLLENQTIFLEVGPGSTLTSLLSQFRSETKFKAVPTIRGAKQEADDLIHFMNAISQFWILGGEIKWSALYKEPRSRVSVPTYAFNRKRHWVDTKTLFSFDYDQDHDGRGEETFKADLIEETVPTTLDRSGFAEEYSEAVSDIQKILVRIWEDYLGIKGIGIIDDFFSLGGHSLLASQVINRVNEYLKIDLPVESLFRTPTIEKLEKLIDEARINTTLNLNLSRIEKIDYLPLSNEQKRLWTVCRIFNNPAYNIPFTHKFKGKLDEGIFSQSINAVLNRHANLRGRITTVDSEPVMVLDKMNQVNIRRIDFSNLTASEKEKKIERFIGEDIRKVFDIENEPLYRIFLIRTDKDEVIFHMTVHHIVFDGWSWGVFVKDLKKAYSGLLQNKDFQLTDVNQYYEYAQWQKTSISDLKFEKSIKYWKEKLKGHNNMLSFPYDYPRKDKRSGLGGKEYFKIDSKVKSELRTLAKNLNITDFMLYISAFSILLNKYSKDEDICIGIPSANRPSSQLEEIIGFFVNSLVLRFRINEKTTFKDYLTETKKVIVEALEHQELPFEKLVEVVQPQRSINSNPIFQVLFAWLNTPSEIFEFQDVTTERYFIGDGVAPLDITVYIWEEKGVIQGEIEYSIDILSADTIHLFINNYLRLLSDIAVNAHKEILELEVLSDIEIAKQKELNNTTGDVPSLLLHQLHESAVKNYSDKKALVSKEGFLTYSELDSKANQLANHLIRLGVKQEDIVGISLDRSFNMFISVLAILKTGATYLPLDPIFPDDRTRFMLEDSGARVLITQEAYIDRFKESSVRRICLEQITKILEQEPVTCPSVNIDGDNIAYMIYTSGSTGMPKGVKVHHKAAVNFINSMAETPGFNHDDVILAVTTLSFDISVLELFLPLSKGGTIVLALNQEISSAESLKWLIDYFNVTVFQATPATWYILVESGWNGNKNLKALCGGEAISLGLIERLLPKVGELWNMYGPTETTVWSTCYKITDAKAPVLIGKPIQNTMTYFMSENNKLQPVGVPGELWIAGEGVSKGYHNRPELTQEKFIPGPDGGITYKTGDVGRLRTDGNIELYGRIDNQIKIRGFRIEPGEIETQLCKIDGIEKAVVKVQKFSEIDERLVAFIIAGDHYRETKDSLIAKLRIPLPDYMIPRAFKTISEFPLTPNGKIDRKKLIAGIDDFGTVEEFGTDKPTASDVEKKILEIWINELKMSNIGVNDNFFDIGGNSILLIQLSDRINKALGKKIDVLNYFQYPTIRSFCSSLLKGNNLQDNDLEKKQAEQQSAHIQFRKRRRSEE